MSTLIYPTHTVQPGTAMTVHDDGSRRLAVGTSLPKLGGDGADQPLLNMIVTEYLSLELTGGDHQEMLLAD